MKSFPSYTESFNNEDNSIKRLQDSLLCIILNFVTWSGHSEFDSSNIKSMTLDVILQSNKFDWEESCDQSDN